MRTLAVGSLLLIPLVLAGCIDAPEAVDPQSLVGDAGLLSATASLWPDHENEPHPAFGWPTLTHPSTDASVPEWWTPIAPAALPETVSGLEHVAPASEHVSSGGGIALFGRLAIVPGNGAGSAILDITDPAAPKLLSTFEGEHRGAATIAYPDGRLAAIISTGAGIEAWNITDPRNPVMASKVEPETGGHKVGVVPGTPIAYNANSAGGATTPFGPQGNVPSQAGGQTEIYDFTDMENPQLVQVFENGYGCHHIFFWIDAASERSRALCAGIEMTQIWDIADPRNPEIIVNVPVHHGNPALPATSVAPVVFSHFAILNEAGDMLIVGDEFMGGLPAECDGVDTPVRDVSGPLGNLWFYDLKDEKNPKLLGFFSPPPHMVSNPDPTAGCTAHHGRLVPDPAGERQLIAMAWYGAGVVLVDFTDPMAPSLVDQWNDGTNTWEAWYYNGYVFTGDLNRGLDVLKLV